MDPDNTDFPRRGGNDFMGPYVGGAPLDESYQLVTTEESFKCALQLRNAKTLLGIESDLRKALSASTALKFDGKLKLEASEAASKELDKEEFLLSVDEAIMSYGLHSFFYLPNNEGVMKYLAEEPHLFTIEQVMSEHSSRLIEPLVELDDNNDEIVTSITARNRCYDKYEKFDISLSRRILETLLSQDIKATIRIKYGHLPNFKSLPGQIIFMMALDVSNASAIQDIDEATTAYKDLTLTSYPGENIVDFATEAQRLIKIMSTGYALPYKTGSTLLAKVEKTESNYFNQQIFRYQSQVKIMERAIGPLVDPKSIVRHSDYPTYGPLGLCALIQEEYGELKRSNEWPALTATLPQGNYTGSNGQKNSGGRRCYICDSENHLAPDCTENRSRREGDDNTESDTGKSRARTPNPVVPPSSSGSSNPNSNGTGTPNTSLGSAAAPASIWKYIHPSDKNQKLEVNGKTYYFCEKCICHHTSKTGFYNTTHTTSQHAPGVGRRRNPSDSTPAAQGNMTPVEDTSSKNSKKPNKADDDTSDDVESDPDSLHFEGAFHTEDGIWMSATIVKDSDDASTVIRPTLSPLIGTGGDWTVEDSSKGSGLSPLIQIPVIMGTSFAHVDIANDMRELDTPIILQGCMTKSEYLLRNNWTDDNHNTHHCTECKTLGPYGKICLCGNHYLKEVNEGFNLDAPYICTRLTKFATSETNTDSVVHNTNASSSYLSSYFDAVCHFPEPTSTKIDIFHDALETHDLCLHNFTTKTGPNDPVPFPFPLSHSSAPINNPTEIPKLLISGHKTPINTPSVTPNINFNEPSSLHASTTLNTQSVTSLSTPTKTNTLHSKTQTTSFTSITFLMIQKMMSIFFNDIITASLFISALFWDTLAVFYDLHPSSLSRKMRRRNLGKRSKVSYQWSYPKHWMILSSVMIFSQFSSSIALHPVRRTYLSIQHTYSRFQILSKVIDLSVTTPYSYNKWRYDDFSSTSIATSHSTEQAITTDMAPKIINVTDTSPAPLEGDYMFNCYMSQVAVDEETLHLDYFDPIDHIVTPQYPSFFDFSSIDAKSDTMSKTLAPFPRAFNANVMGQVDLHPPTLPTGFPVIFDSGASLAISPCKSDFSGQIEMFSYDRFLGGMAEGMKIEGVGNVKWSFKSEKGIITIHSRCYYVPAAKARLISPQRLFNKSKGITGKFITKENCATLSFDNVGSLDINYDDRSHLPIAIAKNLDPGGVQANLCVLNDDNQNLTPSQKVLLLWHARFGHKNFPAIQRLFRAIPFLSEKYLRASRCTIPRCEVCEFSKGHRRPTKGNKQSTNKETDGAIKGGDLRPGASISVDHFESRVKGRIRESYGGASANQYVGGCIFVDHMSNYVHVEHQLGFSSSETIRAKQNFEKLALDSGILVDSYLADNGVFKANAFVSHIRDHNQKLRFCGVNAHHQNATAERNIRTISECARSLLLHASLRWKTGINSNLWPFAVSYATYLYNHLPNEHGLAPVDLFTGVQSPRHKLKDIHVWGAPVYVLHPTLQQGRKLPRWEPRARRGVFLGFSPEHSSDVPLILNLATGSISPQFHVVFDDEFSTVPSIAPDESPPSFWNDLDLLGHVHKIPLDEHSTLELHNEWLTNDELEERNRLQARQTALRQSSTTVSAPMLPETSSIPITNQSVPTDPSQSHVLPPSASTPLSINPITPSTSSTPTPVPAAPPSEPIKPALADPRRSSRLALPRRSTRSTKGLHETRYINQAFLSSICDESRSAHELNLAYSASLATDLNTGEDNCIDPRAYAAKHRTNDPDNPTYNDALTGIHSSEYEAAMIKEIQQLMKQKTWTPIARSKVPSFSDKKSRPVLKGTWAFKLKRLPDGTPLKFKARYCVRGDLQKEGVDYFETYAPVVQWSTVRLLLTLILSNNWTTKQVDYTNAFAQAELNENVYIEPPKGFARKDKKDMVLKLLKSLYGLKQAPRTFFEKLKEGLLERGFTQSILDPCLFMKNNMMCVVYVDDTIIAGPDPEAIEQLITSLGVAKDEQRHTFELRDEGEVGDFLGIRIEKGKDNSFILSQTGLIKKVLKEASMEECNSSPTPASTTPLFKDKEGDPFDESWDYPVIVGMLMYLATNSRPDIAFAVHQCARFTHSPKSSHATAIKRILRYLQGTKEKGMTLTPSNNFDVHCYVDADFAGTWSVEDDQEPVSVKSRSGHLITFMGCPLLWSSKMQSQIALSTMEAEYIALSNSMRDLIGIREILKEIIREVFDSDTTTLNPTYSTISRTFTKSKTASILPKSIVYEDNTACLKFATMPKMSPRTKHIAIPYHFFRSKVEELEIKVIGINTENQVADQFTKGLPQDKFVKDRKALMGW